MTKYNKKQVKVLRDKLQYKFHKTRLTKNFHPELTVEEYIMVMDAVDELHRNSEDKSWDEMNEFYIGEHS